MKWAAPASGGMTLLSTTALSASTTTISDISTDYIALYVLIKDWYASSNGVISLRFNSDSTSNAYMSAINDYPSDATSGTQRAPYIEKGNLMYLTYATPKNTDNNNFASIYFNNYSDTTSRKTLQTTAIFTNAGDNQVIDTTNSAWLNTAAITSISIIGPASFSGGSVLIYGVK